MKYVACMGMAIGFMLTLFTLYDGMGSVHASTAILKIDSNPNEAEVLIDGRLRGKTPCELSIAAGSHAIKLRKRGYKYWEQQITIRETKDYNIFAELDLVHGSSVILKIDSNPYGAEILVDGELRGRTPKDLSLTAGIHTIRLRKRGYRYWEEQITLQEGKDYIRSIRLMEIAR
jgi:hypothetical protein